MSLKNSVVVRSVHCTNTYHYRDFTEMFSFHENLQGEGIYIFFLIIDFDIQTKFQIVASSDFIVRALNKEFRYIFKTNIFNYL